MCSRQVCHLESFIGLVVLCIFILLSFDADPARSQTRIHHPSFVIDRWGMEDGLPVNNVMRIQQTQDGYLWFVTFDGLVRFDGLQFKVYQTEEYPNLPTNRLTNFNESDDGSLWIQTEQHYLVRFKEGAFKHMRVEDGLNGTLCYQLVKGPEGKIWFGTDRGISIYDGETLQPFVPEIIRGNIHRIFVQRNGAVWYMNRDTRNVYQYYDGKTSAMFTAPNLFEFYPLYESDNGKLWIASEDDLYIYEDGDILNCCTSDFNQLWSPNAVGGTVKVEGANVPYDEFDNGFYYGPIAHHYKSGIGEIYSREKSFFTDKNEKQWSFERFTISFDGKPVLEIEGRINSYLFDREGNLWVGTFRNGLYRIKPNPFTLYSRNEGLQVNNVYPIIEDREGAVWAGLFGPGVARINNDRVEPGPDFDIEENVLHIQSLLQKKDGSLLAGVIHNGYFERTPGSNRFIKAEDPTGIETATVYAIHQQANGDLWLGADNGLYWQQNGEWQQFNGENGFTGFAARFFLEDPNGALWIATNGSGIAKYANGGFELFDTESGLGSNLIRSLFIEPGVNSSYAEPARVEASENKATEDKA